MPEINEEIASKVKKAFVVHISVLRHDPGALNILGKDETNLVVIPLCTIEEFSRYKSDDGEAGINIRAVANTIDDLCQKPNASLTEGVQLGEGKGFLIVAGDGHGVKKFWPDLEETNDNRILVIARMWREKMPGAEKVVIISKDINIRIKAMSVGIEAEDYKQDKVGDLYSGYREIVVDDSEVGNLLNLHVRGRVLSAEMLFRSLGKEPLVPNQCFKIYHDKARSKYELAVYKKDQGAFKVVDKFSGGNKEGIRPRNDKQALFYHLLYDDSIDFVTAKGTAGTGKSLIAFLAGYEQFKKGKYKNLLIFKPIIEVGKRTLGYLPGDLQEKMAPWERAIYDNLKLIIGDNDPGNKDHGTGKKSGSAEETIQEYIQLGQMEINPISYIRGRSLNDSFVIVDETQNLEPSEVKTVITRPGENTKVVLVGDVEQIDNPITDRSSNGLTRAIHAFMGYELKAHIDLTQGERSRLAELAAKVM
jgi:PhoH-like ATPase